MDVEKMMRQAGFDPSDFGSAYVFGNDTENITNPALADDLAELVRLGVKTATTSALIDYERENEALPVADGKVDLILNSTLELVAIVRNCNVYVTTFDQVSKEHAFKEGEGLPDHCFGKKFEEVSESDRSLVLEYWRRVHEQFFRRTNVYSPKMRVVCEEFEVLYPIPH